ncbi:hypothetical protein ACQPZF_05585 [Actinosynnema sp. CS-041913]|uniref:hypothetical protein n=1 Tax=Actinosynnema sp. CS-041913 TaxID=3239917 RepID=UPI003D8CC382
MKFLLPSGGDGPRPPLAGRLVGLAIGLALLSLAVMLALDVIAELVAIAVPLLGVALVYVLMFRCGHK